MDIDVIDTRETEPLQAVLETAQRSLARIIPALDERKHADIAVLVPGRSGIGLEQAPDLRREQKALARPLA
jgi:hypothetical protein